MKQSNSNKKVGGFLSRALNFIALVAGFLLTGYSMGVGSNKSDNNTDSKDNKDISSTFRTDGKDAITGYSCKIKKNFLQSW